jgi:hypothetical protein
MTRRERLFSSTGVVLGVVLGAGLLGLTNLGRDAGGRHATVGQSTAGAPLAPDAADAGADPAMAANANLVESLYECSRRLASVTDDDVKLEEELGAERLANRDAGGSSQARRVARRNLSQKDWAQLAGSGTIKYVLPCASFNPSPEIVDQLGLAQGDVPMVRDAFAAARGAAWAQLRPLCAAAVGSAEAADKLGLDACPQLILDTEVEANPDDADSAMRAVASVRAGLLDPSTLPMRDPTLTTFLTMTLIARDAESRIAAQLGPEEARTVAYGRNACSRMVEFTAAQPVR